MAWRTMARGHSATDRIVWQRTASSSSSGPVGWKQWALLASTQEELRIADAAQLSKQASKMVAHGVACVQLQAPLVIVMVA